jgi:ABC-type microcin C transport system permease subunit YejB
MPKTEPSSSIPPLYGATKRQPWKLLVVPGVLGVVVVSLIVVAIARSGHPRTAAAAAHHRTAPLAGSAGGAATKESEAEARSDP